MKDLAVLIGNLLLLVCLILTYSLSRLSKPGTLSFKDLRLCKILSSRRILAESGLLVRQLTKLQL